MATRLTHAVHPDIFDELSREEIDHAIDALSAPISTCPNTDTKRHFNLDIAKLLCVFRATLPSR